MASNDTSWIGHDSNTNEVSTAAGGDYIRTCQSCVTLKVRCIRKVGKSRCERCDRAGRDCVYRRARRRQAPAHDEARIDALEAKLDRLFTVNQQDSNDSGPSSRSNSAVPGTAADTGVSPSPPTSHAYNGSGGRPEGRLGSEASASSSHSRRTLVSNIIEAGFCTPEQAENQLSDFKTSFTPNFPFVVVPPSVEAAKLVREKPFLLLVIIMVTSHENMPLQKFLSNEVRSAISDRLILGGDMSMDILQGLLVYIAWTQYQPRPRQHDQWLYLAMSIIADRSLDKPSDSDTWKTRLDWHKEVLIPQEERTGVPPTKPNLSERPEASNPSWASGGGVSKKRKAIKTFDDYRAVLGCYYLVSSSHILLQKRNVFPHTLYIEEIARHLSEYAEYSTDRYLVHLVKLQEIMEKIDKLSLQRVANHSNLGAVEIWVAGLQSELDDFKQKLPFPPQENYLILSHLHSTELFLYQICLPDREYPDSFGSAAWAPWRLQLLQSAFIAAKLQFEIYLALPYGEERSMSNVECIQLGFMLLLLSKMSIAAAAEPIAKQTYGLRRAFPMSTILTQTQHRIGSQVSPAVDSRGDRDIFYHFEMRIKAVQRFYESNFEKAEKLSPLLRSNASEIQSPQPSQQPEMAAPVTAATQMAYISPNTMAPLFPQGGADTVMMLDGNVLDPDINIGYFLPDTALDEIMGDWTTNDYGPFSMQM